MAVVLSAFQFTGGRLQGYRRDPEIDEVARKEYMRKNRRRPIDETVNQLGEGRGAFHPEKCSRRRILTGWVQVFMRLDTPSEEHRESRRHMASMCQARARRRARKSVYVCISMRNRFPEWSRTFSCTCKVDQSTFSEPNERITMNRYSALPCLSNETPMDDPMNGILTISNSAKS